MPMASPRRSPSRAMDTDTGSYRSDTGTQWRPHMHAPPMSIQPQARFPRTNITPASTQKWSARASPLRSARNVQVCRHPSDACTHQRPAAAHAGPLLKHHDHIHSASTHAPQRPIRSAIRQPELHTDARTHPEPHRRHHRDVRRARLPKNEGSRRDESNERLRAAQRCAREFCMRTTTNEERRSTGG
jgi:hypothetical protein